MKNKVLALVLAILTAFSFPYALTAKETDGKVLLEENFDFYTLAEGKNPNGWYFYKGKSGSTSTVTIKDGAMYFDAKSGGYDVVYADGYSFSDYTLEADVTYLKSTGWFGLAYNVIDGKTWQKGTLALSTKKWSLNGYVSGWKNNSSTLNQGTFQFPLKVNDSVRMRITTKGANAEMYCAKYTNGVLGSYVKVCSISNIPSGSQRGTVGFMMGANDNNTSIKVDNITVTSNATATQGKLLFSETFDSVPLASGDNAGIGLTYSRKSVYSSTAEIKDGALQFTKSSTEDGYDSLFFTSKGFKNYVLEADMTYNSPTRSSGGWAGLIFNVQNKSTYFKATLTLNGRATLNGLSSGKWTNDKEGVNKKDYSTDIDEGVKFRMRVIANGSCATLWYAVYDKNDTLGDYVKVMSISDIPQDMQEGSVGISLARLVETSVTIDNIRVTSLNSVYDGISDIYVPKSGIVNSPVVIEPFTAESAYADKAPAIAIITLDSEMNAVDEDGTVICKAVDFMEKFSKHTIPAFLIDSDAEADALIDFINNHYIIDAHVIAKSPDAHLVKRVREHCPTVKGALIFDGALTKESRKVIRAEVHNNMCYTAILTEKPDLETVSYFNLRQVSIWSFADDTADVYNAIASGYNGVISRNTSLVYEIYESITTTTISGEPFIIAHRGARIDTPENTIEAFKEAVEKYGAKAIETDIRISSDGVCYLMHDSTVDRTTNGSGSGASMTISKLKSLVIDEIPGKTATVPTWEEAVQAFIGTDIVFYCHINVTSVKNITEFCRIINKYGFEDNVVFFITYDKRTEYTSESNFISDGIPFVAGDEPALVSHNTAAACIRAFSEELTAYNYQALFYDYDGYASEEFYYQLSARGFLNFHSITNSQLTLDKTLITSLGSGGALTDDLDLTQSYAYGIQTECEIYGTTINAEKTIMRISGDTVTNCGVLQLSGSPLKETDGVYSLSDFGDVTIVFYADVKGGKSNYRLYSAPVTYRHTARYAEAFISQLRIPQIPSIVRLAVSELFK